jgi:iron(III) transport system permease protein
LPRLGLVAFAGVIAYLVLLPLYRLQQLALSDGAAAYGKAFSAERMSATLGTTVALALGSLVIATVFGTGLAWAATRLPTRLRFLRVVPIMPIVIPAVAAVTGWAFLFSPRPGYLNAMLRLLPWWDHLDAGPVDVYTVPWIVLLTGFGLTSFMYLFVTAGLSGINAELIEAAQASGSSAWGVFFKVTLPLLRPTLVYGGGVALLLGLGQFTAPLLLGSNSGVDVLTTDMYRAVVESPVDYAKAAAIGSPLLLFGVVVVLAQKLLLGDQRRFVTHGGKGFKVSHRPSRLATFTIIVYGFVALVLPLAALGLVSLSKFWSANIVLSELTLDNFRTVLDKPNVANAVINSLGMSILTVAIALPVGFVASLLLLRGRRYRVIRSLVDFIVAIPLGIPAVIFGAGFLFAYTRGPLVLYGTRWVILLVYLTLMLPFTVRMQLAGLVAIGDTYTEASRTSGAGPLRTNLRIVLPLLRPTLGGAGALMFVLLTHEFAASLLVRSPTTQVMGTVLFDFWRNGSYPTVAAIAMIMTVVTGVGVGAATLLGGTGIVDQL